MFVTRNVHHSLSILVAITHELSWLIHSASEMLDSFIDSYSRAPDLEFWKSWYKYKVQSGGDLVSGHILKLFPYDIKDRQNIYLDHRNFDRTYKKTYEKGFDMIHSPSPYRLRRLSGNTWVIK